MDAITKLKELVERLTGSIEQKYAELAAQVGTDKAALKTELDTKIGEIKDGFAQMEAKLVALGRNASLPGVENEKKQFSFLRAAMLVHPQTSKHCWDDKEFGFEKEILMNLRAGQNASDGSAGGYTVPSQLSSIIVEPALEAMPLFQMGLNTITDIPAGMFDVPVMEARGDAGTVSETGKAKLIEYVFGTKQMTPKRISAYAKLSKRLMRASGVAGGIENFIRRMLTTDMSRKLHRMGIVGTGAESQGKGILNYAGFTSSAPLSSVGQFMLEHAGTMKTDLEENDFYDQSMGKFAFLTRSIVKQGIKMARVENYTTQTTGKGFQLSIPGKIPTDAELDGMLGNPLFCSSHVPIVGTPGATGATTSVVYGDWTHFLLALWSGVELSVSDQASDDTDNAFLQNMVFIKVDQEYDYMVDLPAAFCKTSLAAAARVDWTQI